MELSRPNTVIFTDIDGTLIDLATYSFKTSAPAIAQLMKNKVPIMNTNQASLMFGPAQAAVTKAVMDCADEATISK